MLPETVRASLERASEPLRKQFTNLKWVPPERYHTTLSFLGQVQPDPLEACRFAAQTRLGIPAMHFPCEMCHYFGVR